MATVKNDHLFLYHVSYSLTDGYFCKGLPSFYVTSYFLKDLLFKDLVE